MKSIQTVALLRFLMPEVIQVSTNSADVLDVLKKAANFPGLKYTPLAADQLEHLKNIAIFKKSSFLQNTILQPIKFELFMFAYLLNV